MFFGHSEHKKSHSKSPFILFRILLSLMMLSILTFGGYQAFKHFSGVDPIEADPQTIFWSLLESEGLTNIAVSVLGLKVPTNFNELKQTIQQTTPPSVGDEQEFTPGPNAQVILKFALVADSHNDQQSLTKALREARERGSKFVIGLGDYTDVGTDQELEAAKRIFDGSGLPYYLTAGDHDLWNARDKGEDPQQKFHQIFGSSYQSFADSGVRFLILYNSDNYHGIDEGQRIWLEDQVTSINQNPPKLVLAFMHEPLYHPSSDHVMGKVTPGLKSQARFILEQLNGAGVKGIFYGDTHFFTKYKDSTFSLPMTVVGAVTSERNAQRPRFAMVEVYDDGAYNVEDIELK